MAANLPLLRILKRLNRTQPEIHKTTADTDAMIAEQEPDESHLDAYLLRAETNLSILENQLTRFDQVMEQANGMPLDDGSTQTAAERDAEMDDLAEFYEEAFRKKETLAVRIRRINQRHQAVAACTSAGSDGNTGVNQQIERSLNHYEQALTGNAVSTSVSPNAQQGPSNGQENSSFVKLPKLELVKFSGDIPKWKEFSDIFEATVHLNPRLKPVEKLNYLLSQISGDARAVVAGLEITNDNYEVARKLLSDRYGHQPLAISALHTKLMRIPQASNNTPRLIATHDEIESILRSLKALGQDVKNPHFVSLLMTKLPSDVLMNLERSKDPDSPWTVDLLRKKLRAELSAREVVAQVQDNQNPGSSKNWSSQRSSDSSRETENFKPQRRDWQRSYRPGPQMYLSTGETLVANERQGSIKPRQGCIYCGEPHFNDGCPKYSTAKDRRFRIRGRCFNCLSDKHKFHKCTVSCPCVYCGTEKSHHRSLCSNQFPDSNKASKSTGNKKRETTAVGLAEESKTNNNEGSEANTTSTDLCTLATGKSVQLQTAMVQIMGKTAPHQFTAKALMDTASTRSYITEDTMKKLQIRLKPGETLMVNRFASEKKKEITVKSAQIQIILRDGNTLTLTVNAVPNITGKVRRVAINPKKVDNFLWRNLPLADSWPSKEEEFEIQLLIGMDYYLDIVTLEKIQLSENLFLIGSKLGWLLAGRSGEEGANQISGRATEESTFLGIVYTDQHNAEIGFQSRLDDHRLTTPNLEDLWKLDTIGILDCPVELDDDKALECFNNTVKFHDKRYFVTWPWKSITKELPDNYFLAKGRLQSLLTKFKQNPELQGKYNEIIASQLQKGVIEKINHNCCDSELVHYIPHHAVVTPLKATTKNLCGLLLRFSLCSIVLLSDIEKAFLQVGLQVPDREVTRFLWLQDPTKPTLENNLQVYRFCRVPFGVISSPFLLGTKVDHHLKKANSSIAEEIRGNIYVGNVLPGANNVEQALNVYKEAKSLFAEASMNLREWASNTPEFLAAIPEIDRVAPTPNLKVLGINWDCQKDQISILGASNQGCNDAKTKRDVIKIVAQFFDPLGMFLQVTARCKLLIRIDQKNQNHDQNLPKGSDFHSRSIESRT